MPQKHVVRTLVANGVYHVFNRGVNKRILFKDDQDYRVFLSYLKYHLSPPPDPSLFREPIIINETTFIALPRLPICYFKQIDLIAYTLMPNHFHFIIQQKDTLLLSKFIKSLCTRYAMYFNKKYHRLGPLYQSAYKSILVQDDIYLLHLSRYIHRNPLGLFPTLSQAYSSYADYIGLRHTSWVKPDLILNFFASENSQFVRKSFLTYQQFVGADEIKIGSEILLDDLILE